MLEQSHSENAITFVRIVQFISNFIFTLFYLKNEKKHNMLMYKPTNIKNHRVNECLEHD